MYLFTVKYYHEKNMSNMTRTDTARTAKVFANTKDEAILKVKAADDEFIRVTNNGLTFEELLTPNTEKKLKKGLIKPQT